MNLVVIALYTIIGLSICHSSSDVEFFDCTGKPKSSMFAAGCSPFYWWCHKGVASRISCGDGLYFDPDTQKCTAKENVAVCFKEEKDAEEIGIVRETDKWTGGFQAGGQIQNEQAEQDHEEWYSDGESEAVAQINKEHLDTSEQTEKNDEVYTTPSEIPIEEATHNMEETSESHFRDDGQNPDQWQTPGPEQAATDSEKPTDQYGNDKIDHENHRTENRGSGKPDLDIDQTFDQALSDNENGHIEKKEQEINTAGQHGKAVGKMVESVRSDQETGTLKHDHQGQSPVQKTGNSAYGKAANYVIIILMVVVNEYRTCAH